MPSHLRNLPTRISRRVARNLRDGVFTWRFAADALVLLILSGFAVSQPLFDLLAKYPEFFVAADARAAEILLFTSYLVLLFPILYLIPPQVVAGIFGKAPREWTHRALLVVLVGLVFLPALKKIDSLNGWVMLTLAASLGVGFAIAYARFKTARSFSYLLAPSLALFPALFIFNPAINRVIFPPPTDGSFPGIEIDDPAPVVMIVFDEFNSTVLQNQRREIDAAAFPNFAALAREGYWFRNATTVSSGTVYSIPAILNGSYVTKKGGPPHWSNHPNNLFALLADKYQLHVHENATKLHKEKPALEKPRDVLQNTKRLLEDAAVVLSHLLLPSEITTELPQIDQGWKGFVEATQPAANNQGKIEKLKWNQKRANRLAFRENKKQIFYEFVDSIHKSAEPTLHFLHFLFPHRHYKYTPTGKLYPRRRLDAATRARWGIDEQVIRSELQRYHLQVGFADSMIGRLVAHLKREGLYEKSLIVITSDHGLGLELGKHARRLTPSTLADIIPVPLFIKTPGQKAGQISDLAVETIDIFPTIADVLGVDIPFEVDGVSILDPSFRGKSARKIHDHARSFREYTDGELAELPISLELPREGNMLKRKLALFEHRAEDPDKYFRMGPYKGIVSKPLDAFRLLDPRQGVSCRFDSEATYQAYEVGPVSSPSHVIGDIAGDSTGHPLDLALAVNGRIGGVTRSFLPLEENEVLFSFFVPESYFVPGANSVDLYVIVEDGDGDVALRPIEKSRD